MPLRSLIRSRVALRSERAQTIVLVAVLMPVLLGFVGLVLDVGHAYSVQRKLQATADAAALAGAAQLPSSASALSMAQAYGAKSGEKNALGGGDTVSENVATKCLTSVPGCSGASSPNALTVSETATVHTVFAKVLGIKTFSVTAKSTACGICGTQPLNIALVVDRTGSMADNMSDLINAMKAFDQALDPKLDSISLIVLPPSSTASACSPAPAQTGLPLNTGDSYPTKSDNGYVVVHYSTDYLNANGSVNTGSQLVQQETCMAASGGTAYKEALVAAANELANPPAGRAKYQKVIVFESDGAANTAPDSYYDPTSGHSVSGQMLYSPTAAHATDVAQPCGSALQEANTLKQQGITILTVAYNTQSDDGCFEAPQITGSTTKRGTTTWQGIGYKQVSEGTTAATTLAGIASSQDDAFTATAQDAGSMKSAFQTIASDISGSATLIDNSTP